MTDSRLTLLRALLQRDPEVADDRKAGVVVKYATADDAKVRIDNSCRRSGGLLALRPAFNRVVPSGGDSGQLMVERQRQRTA